MIYHVGWSFAQSRQQIPKYLLETYQTRYKLPSAQTGDIIDCLSALTKCIKDEASSQDSFCFLITRRQMASFLKWIETQGLKDYVSYEQPFWSTNAEHDHRDSGGGLKFFVLQSPIHFQRLEAKDEPEVTEENFIDFVEWPNDENT